MTYKLAYLILKFKELNNKNYIFLLAKKIIFVKDQITCLVLFERNDAISLCK